MEERNEQTVEETVEQQEEQVEEQAGTEGSPLEETIHALQAKLADTENRLLRLQADFDNYRRRVGLDKEAAEKYRAQSLVSDLLPALDSFERALQVEVKDESGAALLQGMEIVYRQMMEALQKEGVEAIESVGKPFDPYQHQAVMQTEDSEYEPNTVVEEFQKGYKLKDKVIRVSMVKVNQ